MWVSLVFLQAILVFVLGDDYCIYDILKCDGYRVTFFERVYSRFLITRPTQLRRKCRALDPFMACLQEATLSCYQMGLSEIEAEFIETRRFVKHLCVGSDVELKERFLRSAICINDNIVKTEERCDTAELRSMISELVPAANFSCEYQKALLNCKAKIILNECGVDAGSLFKRTMNLELNMDYVCMDKTNFKGPGGLLSDIVNGLVIFLEDSLKPLLGFQKDDEDDKRHTSPLTSRQPSSTKKGGKKEVLLRSLIEDGIISVEEVSNKKLSKGKAKTYENELRRIGSFSGDLLQSGEFGINMDDIYSFSAQDYYSWFINSLSRVPANERIAAEISKFKGCNEGVSFQDQKANYSEEEFDNIVDEDDEKVGESPTKINYIIVGTPYLPLEINYSNGYDEYTQAAHIKISNQKYLLTPSTDTIPSMNSEELDSTTVLISGTKTEECAKLKHNLHLANQMNEDILEELTCERKSNKTPLNILPRDLDREDIPHIVQLFPF